MTENYVNDIATTLNGAIDESTTSVIVTSAAGFPAVNFVARIESELVLVTGVASNTFTVTRGAESTTAATHASGVAFTHVLSAGSLSRLYQLSNNSTDLTARRRLDVMGRGFFLDDNGTDRSRLYIGDPTTMSYIKDDFYPSTGGLSPSSSEATWVWVNGTVPTAQVGEANHPGIWRRSTAATTNTACYTMLTQIIPSDTWSMVWIVRLNNNDTDTALAFGLSDQANQTTSPTNGILFRKALADTNWQTVTRATSVETGSNFSHEATDAVNGPVSTSFARFGMRRVDASTIGFRINSGAEKLHTANIPTAAMYPWIRILSSTGTAKTFDIDYFDCLLTGLTR